MLARACTTCGFPLTTVLCPVQERGLSEAECQVPFIQQDLTSRAKVSKGEILIHFNEIFDALSKVSKLLNTVVAVSLPAKLTTPVVCRFGNVGQERRRAP